MNRNRFRDERDDKLADKNLYYKYVAYIQEEKSINMIKREIKDRKPPMGLLKIKKYLK